MSTSGEVRLRFSTSNIRSAIRRSALSPSNCGRFAASDIVFSGAQIAWHHWRHYQYTLDEAFLRERAYPLIRGVAEFYRTFPNLRRGEDGRDHLHLLNDQELLWGVRDPHNEIWAARGMLTHALHASRILDVDAALRKFGAPRKMQSIGMATLATIEHLMKPKRRQSASKKVQHERIMSQTMTIVSRA